MNKPTAGSNRFCFAEHAIVAKASGDGWDATFTNGSSRHLSDADLARRGFAVDCPFGHDGFYAILDGFREHASYTYRPDPSAGVVWLENGSDPVPMDEFLMSAVRADAAGRPICSLLSEANQQLYAASNARADGHVAEIIGGVTAHGSLLVRDWMEEARIRNGADGLDNDEILSMVA